MGQVIKCTGAGLAFAAGLGLASAALAQECVPTVEMNAVSIVSEAGETLVSVAGDHNFYQPFGNGWVFGLVRQEFGWSIRLYDGPDVGDATDLTSLTPPHGGAPNPRDIFGWHFRNAANTGPNAGDVNAPQQLRAFVISPGLVGTGGYKPSTDPDELRLREPGPEDGIGWLKVEDMGLGNLNPGEQATMNFLEFSACLSWAKSGAEQVAEADAASLEFTALDEGLFTGCGLDMAAYKLDAQFLPRRKNIDMDSDGSTDVVAQIVRKSDDAHGLALCRNGDGVDIFGFADGDAGPDLPPDYVGQTEAWQWVSPGGDMPRHISGYDLPQSAGGHLVLERVEKQAVTLFWRDGVLGSEQLYRLVEP